MRTRLKNLFLLLVSIACLSHTRGFCSPDEPADWQKTSHLYTAQETPLPYTAITGTLPVADKTEASVANLFFIAYLVEDAPERPITFFFPGGPGGACGIEAICTIGPKRLQLPEEGKTLLPPYQVIENPESLLPWTDLVFVDPVATGYSKYTDEVKEEEKRHFFSTDGDIALLGNFVQRFIAYFQKWNCPKYLAGISYGTVRCSGLAEYLTYCDFSLHGLLLMSACLDYSTLINQYNNPIADSLLIPTFAATAWYHGRFQPSYSLEEVVEYARRFVYDEYIPYLLQPYKYNSFESAAFYNKLAQLIGLNLESVRRYCGRFDEKLYTTEFMASERKVIGGLDTRRTGDLSSIRRRGDDPSYRNMQGVWCAFHAYLSKELQTYRPFDSYVPFASLFWNYDTYDSYTLPDLTQRIRRTLVHNPSMRIFAGSGYYDCRTPFAATEYCFNHIGLPLSYRDNFQFAYYPGGHGFMLELSSLKQLKTDLVKFYTTPPK